MTGKITNPISSIPIKITKPTKPVRRPAIWRRVVFWRNNKIAIINANNGEVPFRIDNVPAVSSCADQAYRKNGKAAFMIPSKNKEGITLVILSRSDFLMNNGPNNKEAKKSLIKTK